MLTGLFLVFHTFNTIVLCFLMATFVDAFGSKETVDFIFRLAHHTDSLQTATTEEQVMSQDKNKERFSTEYHYVTNPTWYRINLQYGFLAQQRMEKLVSKYMYICNGSLVINYPRFRSQFQFWSPVSAPRIGKMYGETRWTSWKMCKAWKVVGRHEPVTRLM